MILFCGCTEPANEAQIPFVNKDSAIQYQDKRYGQGNRVHNPKRSKNIHTSEFRCTICLKVQSR